MRYNVQRSPDKEAFELTAEQNSKGVLNVCAKYQGGKNATDMVVIEIELLSGFTPVVSSLEALFEIKGREIDFNPVKKYEYEVEDGVGKIVLYFNEMTVDTSCWDIELLRKTVINELKPAVIKIYDYYDPEEAFSTQYNIKP